MPMKKSAGILVYRVNCEAVEVLLVRDKGSETWSLPKGEFNPATESPIHAALREVREELGISIRLYAE